MHKKVCKDLTKDIDSQEKTNQKLKARLYNPSKKADTHGEQQNLFAEACGLGLFFEFFGVHRAKVPVAMSNAITFKAVKNDTIFKTENHSEHRTVGSVGCYLKITVN